MKILNGYENIVILAVRNLVFVTMLLCYTIYEDRFVERPQKRCSCVTF